MPLLPSVTVLISGRGSNLTALHESASGYRIGAVVSNNPEAAGLNWAQERDIPCYSVFRNNFQSQPEFKTAVLDAVRKTSPDIVALAGFMVVLQPDFVNEFSGRLINIHPSLLPKFPGLDTHRRALAAHEAEHGTSVHFVATGVDTGALIAQGKVPVLPSDSPEILAERTLKVEHQLYPWVVSNLAKGAIALRGDSVEYSDLVRSEAEEKGFIIPGL